MSGLPVVIPDYALEIAYTKLMQEFEKTEPESPGNQVLAFYIAEYQTRFGKRPFFESRETKRLKDYAQMHGVDRMKKLVSAYLEMKDELVASKGHDLFTFLNSLNRIARIVDSSAPRPLVIQGTSKPAMEIHPTPRDPEPIVPPPPDVREKIKNLKLASLTSAMPAPAPKPDPESRREVLRKQAELIEQKGKK